jgi:hypothetical protein
MNDAATFCTALGIEVPLICGAMYSCSNPELVVSARPGSLPPRSVRVMPRYS